MFLLGHEVRLVRPIYVKPFGKRQKNDAAAAEAVLLHWLALNALGVSIVPGNPDYTADELTCLLEHGEAALLVVLPSRLAQVEGVAQGWGLRSRKRLCARPCQASAKTAGQQAGRARPRAFSICGTNVPRVADHSVGADHTSGV